MNYQSRLFPMIVVAFLIAATTANAQNYTVLSTYSINSGSYSGIVPAGLMSQGRDGLLYGTISNNGGQNSGTAFTMSLSGSSTSLHSFCTLTSCTDGSFPQGGLTLGTDGNLYGTTADGGTHNSGTVFKISSTGMWTKLWDFSASGSDEGLPWYPPFQGQDGNFYGVDPGVYSGTYGILYKMTPAGQLTSFPFSYTNGANPNLPTQGTDGNFYGTARGGGSKGAGVVYKMTPAGQITVLHDFTGYPSDGYLPVGVLVQGNDGNFYGATYQGGAHNQGCIFKITPTGVLTLLYSFNDVFGSDAANPWTGLIAGSDGNFYGTSFGGAHNSGTLYKVTSAGILTILYNFCSATGCVDGFSPETPLVQDTNGKFYGNTSGNSLGGSVFYRLDTGLAPFVNLVTRTGKVGKTIGILGQGFTGTTGVLFNGVAATFSNVSDTYMTATVPSGATTGLVTVTTFTNTLKSNRKFLVAPQVTTFNPPSGTVGTSLTITGVSFTQATKVTIGGKAASFTVNSDTQVTAIVPAGARTGQKIIVTTPGGTASSAGTFAVVPKIASFSPTSGPVGTSVVITGNSFTGTTKVSFGGIAATSLQVISDTQVDALVPTGAVTGKIQVTTPGGTATSSASFTVTP